VLDLNLVVTDMEKMLHRLIGEHIKLRTELRGDIGPIKADRGQIEQVILNLVVNARDAMAAGGDLTVRTEKIEIDADEAVVLDCAAGPYVVLSVVDTGCGIPPVTIPHIFEPFFTTKDDGKGTGLGLSTVYGIVSQSGGRIDVDSVVDHGTTFRVSLPQVVSTAAMATRVVPEEISPPGTETILLVEDDDGVRQMAREILVEAGYEVIDSASPAEALMLLSSCPQPSGLVLTDMIMPGMNGRQLVQRLQGARPFWRVLYMSGYPQDTSGDAMLLEPGAHFLPKPFTRQELLRKVRDALDGRNVAA
jgi:two-component system cell cycle sensor histidine kinase/response regulator CckA